MSKLSRRLFLKSSSAAVVTAGAIAALPGVPALIGAVDSQAPADAGAAEAAVTDLEGSAPMSEPLIAHVKDLATGEISLLSGTREITVLDPRLAASLIRALR
jgi:hypothetical protein